MREEGIIAERLRASVRALRHRNYRVYFFAMLVSFTGTWMQSVAQSWLVYRLTGSAFLLGLVGFAGQVPVFLFAPLGGVMADRHSRHRIIILTQTLAMIQAFALAALTLSGRVSVGAVFALAIMLGVVNAFDLPTRQSFMVEMVGRDDLMNAIALNSSMIQGSRVIGPAIAGLMLKWVGEGLCFLINGLSYIVIIAGLLTIRISGRQTDKPDDSPIKNLIEGFDYIRRERPVRALLLLVAFVSIFGLPYIVLMPVFASDVLKGGPGTLGILMGAAGVGALAGAFSLALRRQIQGLGRIPALSAAAFGLLLILFSLSRNLILSSALLAFVGFTLLLQMSSSNTLVQTIIPDRMRGRMMSFYSMSLMGMAPFGSLLSGAVAARIGAPETVAAGGALCVLAAILFYVRIPELRLEAVPAIVAQAPLPGEPSEISTVPTE
ncbi:MAG TPA: MFS transporter [Blastocatellia bacterium]|nr:MFS transporter [Blastocatellia bacterium]